MRKIIRIISILCMSLIFTGSAYGIRISEIMFNPNGSDTGREWVRIEFNSTDGCINLTEYRLYEENVNHNIYFLEINPYLKNSCNQAIICNDVNKLFLDYPSLNSSQNNSTQVYKSAFSLSNTGEELGIRKSEIFFDYINYSTILAYVSVAEGYSLVLEDDVWKSSENTILEDENETENTTREYNSTYETNSSIINESVLINETMLTNETFNETSENETEDININETEVLNETGNITNSTLVLNTTENPSICLASIQLVIKNESKFYENNVQIKFYNKINYANISYDEYQNNYSIEYWVEDLSGNIVKNKVITTNQAEKSFTPNIGESDKILLIKNTLKQSECTVINQSGEKILLIKNNNYVEQKCPKTDCPKCDDKKTPIDYSKYTTDYTASVLANCDQKPIIKTVNVCNASKEYPGNTIGQNASQNLKSDSTTLETRSINISKNNTQTAGKTTSMIVYESPNLKNRLYALIGLILVGITCTAIVFYKVFKPKIITNKTD